MIFNFIGSDEEFKVVKKDYEVLVFIYGFVIDGFMFKWVFNDCNK